eukprot:2300313-Pyramimonas_sp.AAC.1
MAQFNPRRACARLADGPLEGRGAIERAGQDRRRKNVISCTTDARSHCLQGDRRAIHQGQRRRLGDRQRRHDVRRHRQDRRRVREGGLQREVTTTSLQTLPWSTPASSCQR